MVDVVQAPVLKEADAEFSGMDSEQLERAADYVAGKVRDGAILVGVSAAIPVLALVYQTVRRELMALAREPDQAVRTYRALPTIPGPGPTPMRLAIRRGFLLAPVSFILAISLAVAAFEFSLISAVLTLGGLVYVFVMLSGFGRSLGGRAAGIKVVRSDGQPVGLRRGLLRAVVGAVSIFVTLGLGFYLIAFDGRKRALSDVLAGTVVIRTASAAQGQPETAPAYAGFGQRWWALTIDGTIILSLTLAVAAFESPLIAAVLTLGGLVYIFVALSGLRRTLGGRAAGTKVVRSDRQPVGLRRGLLRAVIGAVSTVVTLGLGFFLIAFDGRKRALYDMLAGTVVIRTR